MKKLIAVMIIAMFFLIGCIGETIPEFEGKDCGADILCYQEALQTCTPAKVEVAQATGDIGVTLYSHIQGGTIESCTIYQKITEITIPEGTDTFQAMAINTMKGADATCIGPVNKLGAGTLDEFEQYFECEGTLYEIMKLTSQAKQVAVEE